MTVTTSLRLRWLQGGSRLVSVPALLGWLSSTQPGGSLCWMSCTSASFPSFTIYESLAHSLPSSFKSFLARQHISSIDILTSLEPFQGHFWRCCRLPEASKEIGCCKHNWKELTICADPRGWQGTHGAALVCREMLHIRITLYGHWTTLIYCRVVSPELATKVFQQIVLPVGAWH